MEDSNAQRQRYRVVVRGRLSERLGSAFGELELQRRAGQTVLSGNGDRERLDAVLDRLHELGLEVVSVNAERLTVKLVAALKRGDERAFAALIDDLGSSLLRVAMGYISSRAVAEEVVQETWLGGGPGTRPLRGTFLPEDLDLPDPHQHRGHARGARKTHRAVLVARRRRRGAARSRSLPPERPRALSGPLGARAHAVGDTGAGLVSAETREVVTAAIEELPDAQRTVVTLRDVEGWPSGEVCDALEISEGNQRVLLHRARTKVRAALERYYDAAELTVTPAGVTRAERWHTSPASGRATGTDVQGAGGARYRVSRRRACAA